jgi:hypothetical protein
VKAGRGFNSTGRSTLQQPTRLIRVVIVRNIQSIKVGGGQVQRLTTPKLP